MKNNEWNAKKYSENNRIQMQWAQILIDEIEGDSFDVVLDAGCGVGNVTELLAQRFSKSKIYATDQSQNMLNTAKERYEKQYKINFSLQNLLDFEIDRKIDLLFSNSVIHWISDHKKLYTHFYDSMNDGGSLYTAYSAKGSVRAAMDTMQEVIESKPFKSFFENYSINYNFVSAEETNNNLKDIGFKNINVSVLDLPVHFDKKIDFLNFVEVTFLSHPTSFLKTAELQQEFVNEYEKRMRKPNGYDLDFQRFIIKARK